MFADSIVGVDADLYPDEELIEQYESLWNWRRLPGENDDDWTQVIALQRWASECTFARAEGDVAREFADWFDVDNSTDSLAIHSLIGDIDSFGDDDWLFHNQFDNEPRWKVIPWDKDLAFGSHLRGDRFGTTNDLFADEYGIDTVEDNGLVSRVLEDARLPAGLGARLRELMDEVVTLEYFELRTATIADAIEESVTIDPATPNAFEQHPANHHGELGRFRQHVESLLDFVKLRYAFLDRVIDPVDGAPDVSAVSVDDVRWDDRVVITDADGVTIGWLDVTTLTPATRQLTLASSRRTEGTWTVATSWRPTVVGSPAY